MRKALSIIAIALGYFGLLTFATIELARYYGWITVDSSASILAINKFYSAFSEGAITAEVTILASLVVIAALAFLSVKLYGESRIRAARKINIAIPVSLEAAYFGETYSKKAAKEATPSLDQQYDYLLNK